MNIEEKYKETIAFLINLDQEITTVKQYNKIAKENNLLICHTLRYVSKMNFQDFYLIKVKCKRKKKHN